jgi:hypothetical protein
MRKTLLMAAAAVSVTLGAGPAFAGFFLEGLKPFTQEPKCPDPYATNRTGCDAPDTAYPAPPKGGVTPDPDVRTTTRTGTKK